MNDTPRTDAVKDYEERCEILHGNKIVTHAMCDARASEETDELRSLCESLERKLAAAILQRDDEYANIGVVDARQRDAAREWVRATLGSAHLKEMDDYIKEECKK
jgi:predicted TIM-barrel fold metal-dependent hydrolase